MASKSLISQSNCEARQAIDQLLDLIVDRPSACVSQVDKSLGPRHGACPDSCYRSALQLRSFRKCASKVAKRRTEDQKLLRGDVILWLTMQITSLLVAVVQARERGHMAISDCRYRRNCIQLSSASFVFQCLENKRYQAKECMAHKDGPEGFLGGGYLDEVEQ